MKKDITLKNSEEKINRITKDMNNLEVNRLYDYKPLRQAPRIKNYYPRPTNADLQLEENSDITSSQFDGRSLVE